MLTCQKSQCVMQDQDKQKLENGKDSTGMETHSSCSCLSMSFGVGTIERVRAEDKDPSEPGAYSMFSHKSVRSEEGRGEEPGQAGHAGQVCKSYANVSMEHIGVGAQLSQ